MKLRPTLRLKFPLFKYLKSATCRRQDLAPVGTKEDQVALPVQRLSDVRVSDLGLPDIFTKMCRHNLKRIILSHTSKTLLTPWTRVLQKLIVPRLFKKFPVFYETRMLIAVFPRVRHRPYTRLHESIPLPYSQFV